MVRLTAAREANEKLLATSSLVAVFVGGTSGIGEYTLRSLANLASKSKEGSGLQVYLVGRNTAAADAILSHCRQVCPKGRFEFVKAEDLALLRDVDRCCEEILKLERTREERFMGPARLDVLVMSQAVLHFGPRKDTAEGLDISMSLLYYSRMRFITQLLPLLQASSLPTGAKCISIYAGGFENKKQFHPDDFALLEPEHFSFAQVRSQVTYMKTLFFEHLALQNEGKLSCIHIYPGLVITPSMSAKSNPWWFKTAWFFIAPFAKLYATSAEDIGQRILFLATDRYSASNSGKEGRQGISVASGSDGKLGGGGYSVRADGETNDLREAYEGFDREGMREKVWQHTMEVFDGVSKST